ncbi:unnamed protein product, partial [Rotaria sp. Silwood1]
MLNIPVYDPESKRTVLQEDRATESTIKQRLGRLGRTQPGEYYSLKSPLKQELHYMKQFFPDPSRNNTIDQAVKILRALAKNNFHSIDIQLHSDTLSIEGTAGISLKAELYFRQQLTTEQSEFELENRFDSDTEEYKNLSRNLESIMKMSHIFKPMIWRWEAERQAKITVNPNTSTKNITVKVVARDSDYENIKKEFKSFVRWLGYCAVMRRPNT